MAKWKIMKKDYKEAVDKRNKTGEGRDETATCVLYEEVRCRVAWRPHAADVAVQLHAVLKDDKRIHPAAVGDSGRAGGAGAAPAQEEDGGAAAASAKPKQKVKRGAAAASDRLADSLRALAPAPADPTIVGLMATMAQQGATMKNFLMLMAAQTMPDNPAMQALLASSMASAVAPATVSAPPPSAPPRSEAAEASSGPSSSDSGDDDGSSDAT